VALEVLTNKVHKECGECPRDETCTAEKKSEHKDKIKELREGVAEYVEHKEIADHQAAEMRTAKQNLGEGECLIVEDFAGRFLVKAALELSQNDYFARVGVPDLVVCAYYMVGKKIVSKTFDLLANTKEKDDFYYLRAAWVELLAHPFFEKFKNIKIWSDGGPKHFKIRKSLYLFSLIDAAYPQEFEWNFFQSCHGKGPCDAHVGYLKNLLKKEVLRGEIINDETDLELLFREKALKAEIIKVAVNRDEVDCSEFRQGIRKFYCFGFDGAGRVKCFRKSGDTEFILQTVTSKAENFLPVHYKQAQRTIPMDLE